MMITGSAPPKAEDSLRRSHKRFGDSLFRGLSTGSGIAILALLAAVAAFLVGMSIPALTADARDLPFGEFWSYVAPYAFGTVWAAALAMILAVPLSIGIALFLTHYAHKRVRQVFGYIIDLLAAVPSVVFGLWGINVLAPLMRPFYVWLHENLGWIPFFAGPVSGTGRTILTVAVVLAVMVLPIITAVCREVFTQTPLLHQEAALALGATRWEMIRTAVIPYGMPGIVSGCMLGLGRALGETMAVAMVLSPAAVININLISSSNPNTIASNIALSFPEAYQLGVNQLIATGLVLFVITLAVNMTARWVISRRAEFSGAN